MKAACLNISFYKLRFFSVHLILKNISLEEIPEVEVVMCTNKVRWAKGGLVCQVLNSEGVVERVKKGVQRKHYLWKFFVVAINEMWFKTTRHI